MILMKKDEKITNFKAVNDSDVIKKTFLDEKLSKKEGHLSLLEKDYNEVKLHNKQSVVCTNFNSKSCENDFTNTL